MHDCKTAHPGKTHRRRNGALKRALIPKRWWEDERAKTGEWGGGAYAVLPERPSGRSSGFKQLLGFSSAPKDSPAPPETQEPRVQVY